MLAHEVRGPVAHAGDVRGVKRVLLAFDGSPGSQAALEQAITVAVDQRALLTIAGVVCEPTVWMGFGPAILPYTREGLQRDLERALQRHLAAARDEVPATVSVTTRLLHGRPARALAELAEEGGYDLVVVGPRRGGRLRRWLGASVTHSLLSRVNVSVLAVRAPEDPAPEREDPETAGLLESLLGAGKPLAG